MDSPTREEIRALRKLAGLTQQEAAARIYSTRRTYQEWESGNVKMHPALWELLNLKVTNIMVPTDGINEVSKVSQLVDEAREGRQKLQVAVDRIADNTQQLLALRKQIQEEKLPITALLSAYILSTYTLTPSIEDISTILLQSRLLVAALPPLVDVVDWVQKRSHFVEAVKLMQAVYEKTIKGGQRLNPGEWLHIPIAVRYWLTDITYRYHKE